MTDKEREEYLKYSNVYDAQKDHPLAYEVWLRMHFGF
jgi:hypothetical protein